MASGDFDVTITHRYRVVVPLLASGLAASLSSVQKNIWPHRSGQSWSLQLSFMLVNLLLMSAFGILLWEICELYQMASPIAIIATLALLSSRWANYSVALPLIDSLYLLAVAFTFWSLKAKNKKWLYVAIVLGVLAKESYLLFFPMLVWWWPNKNRWQAAAPLLLSVVLMWFVRYTIDTYFMAASDAGGVQNALNHAENIVYALGRMGGLRGAGEIATVAGPFTLVMLAGCWGGKNARKSWLQHIDKLLVALILTASGSCLIIRKCGPHALFGCSCLGRCYRFGFR